MGRYDAIAGVYEGLLRVGSFGRIEDLYRAVAGELVGLRGARLVIRAKAPLVGAHPSALPLEFARARLEGLHVRHFFGGVYTLVSGRVPGGSSASS